MHDATPLKRKRPVNLTLSVGLVAQAKTYTNNLSETMEALLAGSWPSKRKPGMIERNLPTPAYQIGTRCMRVWVPLQTNTSTCNGPV